MRILWKKVLVQKFFFANMSIKTAIFIIFQIRQKYWILWGKPVPTPCFRAKIEWFLTKCHLFGGFSVFGQKRAPCKKFEKSGLAIPHEFWLPFIWIQPFDSRTPTHMRKGGGAEPLHCIPSIGVYIYIYIYERVIESSTKF